MTHIKKGDTVSWKWGMGRATGTVVDVTPDTVTITTKGKKITRHGTPDNPVITIKNDQDTEILKLESELDTQI